jgi:hypothetical protein
MLSPLARLRPARNDKASFTDKASFDAVVRGQDKRFFDTLSPLARLRTARNDEI